MSRTAVTYSALVADGVLADPAGTSVASGNGGVIAAATPERTLLRIANASGSTSTITIDSNSGATAVAPAQGGAAMEGLAAGGDLTFTIATATTKWYGPFTSFNTLQSDASLIFDTTQTVTVTAFQTPHPQSG